MARDEDDDMVTPAAARDAAHDARWEEAEEIAELLRDDDREGAVALGEEITARSPKNEYAFFFLGSAYFELGQHGKAMKAFVRALELAPTYVGAMNSLGHTLRMLGRHDEAIRLAKQVLARSAEDPDALHLLGLSHFARGERAAALKYLERFLATRPEVEAAFEVEGLVRTLRGDVVALPADDEN